MRGEEFCLVAGQVELHGMIVRRRRDGREMGMGDVWRMDHDDNPPRAQLLE